MTLPTDAADSEFKFEIAISFERTDESLAAEIADLLQDRFRIFIYSKRQDLLAGRDGEERFGEVFSAEARIVVVLCRPEWGQTPFTRIEETAIRNRAFSEGYDFSLCVPTTDPPFVPKWLPRTRLYFGLPRFGVKGLAAVVERLIEEQGVAPRLESVADRAARFQRAEAFRLARERFNKSHEGVKMFGTATDALSTTVVGIVVVTYPSRVNRGGGTNGGFGLVGRGAALVRRPCDIEGSRWRIVSSL